MPFSSPPLPTRLRCVARSKPPRTKAQLPDDHELLILQVVGLKSWFGLGSREGPDVSHSAQCQSDHRFHRNDSAAGACAGNDLEDDTRRPTLALRAADA